MLAGSSSIGTTEIIAVYGAAVATAVFIWEIYKWKVSGPRIRFMVVPAMQLINVPRVSESDTFIVATATNVGDRPTTITNLGIRWYRNWLWYTIGKSQRQAIVAQNVLKELPHILEAGTQWKGLSNQDEIGQFTKSGVLICELHLSHRRRPKTARIRVKEVSVGETL